MREPTCSTCGCTLSAENWSDQQQKARSYRCIACHRTYNQKYAAAWRARNRAKSALGSIKRRAVAEGVPFSLTADDLHALQDPGLCPVLGIEMARGDGKIQDASPTVDRLVPEEGYTPNNIRIISQRANKLKSDGTLDELKALVRYMEEALCPALP